MSYSRWRGEGLGWYIYHDTNGKLFVSPGCPADAHPLSEHLNGPCPYAEFLSRERATMLRDILTEALSPENDKFWKEKR